MAGTGQEHGGTEEPPPSAPTQHLTPEQLGQVAASQGAAPQAPPAQYAPPPAPAPPAQYAPAPGQGVAEQGQHTGVQLRTKFFFLALILFLFPPTVVVNGYEQKIKWGETWLPLQPGSYRLEVFFRYLFFGAVGRSAVDVVVHPGQVQQWQWKAPWFIWSKGKWKQQG